MKYAVVAVAVLLAGCGGARDERPKPRPISVRIETYLATPEPGTATLANAERRCLSFGRRASYRSTLRTGPRSFDHIYDCVAP